MPPEIRQPEIKPLNQIYQAPAPEAQPPEAGGQAAAEGQPPELPGAPPAQEPPAEGQPPAAEGAEAPPPEQAGGQEEKPPATPDDSPEARARADLERRDRELFQRETWMSQKMQELKQWEQIRQLARDNPAEAARQLGIDTLRLAEGLMGGPPQEQGQAEGSTGDKVLDYIKKLETKIESLEGGFHRQTAVGEIKSGLSAGREQYPMLATVAESNPGFYEQLHKLQEQYRQGGRQVELRELFQQQEDFYTQSMLQSLTKVLSVPKLRDKVSELINKQPPGATQKPPPPAAPPAQRTLRNNMNAEPPSEVPRPKTPEEAALEARKFKLWAD